MKVIISTLNSNLHSSLRFKAEALLLGHEVSVINPYKSEISSTKQVVKDHYQDTLYLHRTTGVNFDDFDLLLSKHYAQSGMRVANHPDVIAKLRSKDQQLLHFLHNDISHVPSLTYRSELTKEIKNKLIKLENDYAQNEGFILKMLRGNKGIGVNFLANTKSLFSLLETFYYMKDQRFLIQPFIKHEHEYRVFIIKDKVSAIIERTIGAEEFRGNANRQESARSIDTNEFNNHYKKLSDFSLGAISGLGIDYCGLDILLDKEGNYRLLEINLVPGFEQVEDLSGKNIAKEILVSLLE